MAEKTIFEDEPPILVERVVWVDITEGRGAAGIESLLGGCSSNTKPTVVAPTPGGDQDEKIRILKRELDKRLEELRRTETKP